MNISALDTILSILVQKKQLNKSVLAGKLNR